MTYLLLTRHAVRFLSVIFVAAFISACSSTTTSKTSERVNNQHHVNNDYYQSMDAACEQQAIEMNSFAQHSGQAAQYLASAKAMLRCVKGIQFPKNHPDADKALRLMALSVINLIKGGDIDGAHIALKKTQSKFPNKDLFFADYSSFFDTATALFKQENLSQHQLAVLNISSDLRTEIKRHQYWLRH